MAPQLNALIFGFSFGFRLTNHFASFSYEEELQSWPLFNGGKF
jgi:hypothetical protein